MPLTSMTGFARSDGANATAAWHWEVRSVNARGLDVRLRLPPGIDWLEPQVRETIAGRFVRGNISVALTLAATSAVELRLNEQALAQVVAAARRVQELTGGEPPRVEGLLAIRGVLESVEPDASDEARATRGRELLASLRQALDGVAQARAAEGGRLTDVIASLIDQVAMLTAEIAASPSRSLDAMRRRIGEQVARILEAGTQLDPGRLHQEAVLAATRADIEEELKRLASHITAARELIAAREPSGRRFDFLAQEFHREANTLCSKSVDPEVTRRGLSLKVLIDQLREQVQNIE
jgi:uncharacterized protein (TIGR00255 family)